jgi:hypothetical protein
MPLGRGGFGSVFRGVLPRSKQAVATKRMKEFMAATEFSWLLPKKMIPDSHPHLSQVTMIAAEPEGIEDSVASSQPQLLIPSVQTNSMDTQNSDLAEPKFWG